MTISGGQPSRKQSNRRDQILDECLLLVGHRGYRGFSFKDLAERCNLTKQGVLHYFPSKERLLLSLLDERDASIEAYLLELLSSGGFNAAENSERMRAVFRESLARVIEHMAAAPDLIRLHVVLRAEAINPDHPASTYFIQRDRATLAWLTERASPFCENAASTARQILATMIGMQQQWLQEEMGFDLAAEWRGALAMVLPDPAV